MSASPPLAPAQEGPIYFVLCDYGPGIGRAYFETEPDEADRETVIRRLMRGEYVGPVQILEVDLPAGRARDASADFAEEVLRRATMDELPADVGMFVTIRAAIGAS